MVLDCFHPRLGNTIAFTAIGVILIICTIYILFTFIKRREKNPLNVPKIIKIIEFLFVIITLTAMIMQILVVWDVCSTRGSTNIIYFILFNVVYILQESALLTLWVIRISMTFDSSVYEISRHIIRAYYIILFLGTMIAALTAIFTLLFENGEIWLLSTLLTYVMYIIAMLYLSAMFLRKLFKLAYLMEGDDSSRIRSVIIKYTILTCATLGITLATALTVAIASSKSNNIYTDIGTHFMLLIDIFTKYICSILLYKWFDPVYNILCKPCQSCCSKCFSLYIRSKNAAKSKIIFIKISIEFNRKINIHDSIAEINKSITEILLTHLQNIGVEDIKDLKVSSNNRAFYISFECVFETLDRLSYQVINISGSTQLAMENGIVESLLHNNKYYSDIIKLFKDKNFEIINMNIQQTNDSVQQILDERKEKAANISKNDLFENIRYKPLREFEAMDVYYVIKSWVLNDIKLVKKTKLLLNITTNNQWSGIEIFKMKNYLKVVLEKEILHYMTQPEFNKLYKHLETVINNQDKSLLVKSAIEIGILMADYSLNTLLKYITNNDFNGAKVAQRNSVDDISWIKDCTGWSDDDIKQIIDVLLRYNTTAVADQDNECTKILADKLNLIELKLKLRFGDDITDESEIIMNAVDEIQKMSIAEYSNVDDIYKSIANTLIGDVRTNWFCCNCGCYNFDFYIGGKLENNLNICRLCGISHLNACINALKGKDSYTHYSHPDASATNPASIIPVPSTSINISCPVNNQHCPSIINLCKKIQYYQNWLNNISNSQNINTTTNIDISKLDNKIFAEIVLDSIPLLTNKKKLNENEIKTINQMLNENILNINDLSTLSLSKYAKSISNKSGIKHGTICKLFKIIKKSAKNKMQTIEFGEFLLLDANEIDDDYYHIINIHIKNGDKITKENVFRYFQENVICDNNCNSISRNKRRMNTDINDMDDIRMHTSIVDKNNDEDKHIWSKKQYYIQSQLDIIHEYFVHYDWKQDINKNTLDVDEQKELEDDNELEEEKYNTNDTNVISSNIVNNSKGKFTSDIFDSKSLTQYTFGIDHDYAHLSPIYNCLRDEIIKDGLININIFEQKLIKSIAKHQIGINKYELRCTHYDPEYNINRNHNIGIRHILSMSLYTDCTSLCTKYRATYRRLSLNETEKDVTQRHCLLYWLSRFLFEAIEFFGEEMSLNMKVYHGLNKKMMFGRFTTYFNQPISTTTSFNIAQSFCAKQGIILVFSRFNTQNKELIPKYMDVNWLSAFPNEDEKLFYGKDVIFEIYDIRQGILPHQSNKKYFKIFNIFQQLIKGDRYQQIKYLNDDKMVNNMIQLIMKKKENQNKMEMCTFNEELFNFFCDNQSSWICIAAFESLPISLKIALFGKDDISLIEIHNLFQNCTQILLNELNKKLLTENCLKYIDSVIKYIEYLRDIKKNNNLTSIIFESEIDYDRKPNSTLRRLSKRYNTKFISLDWCIKYEFKLERNHRLMFNAN